MIELTVYFETRFEEAHVLKVGKYADLMEQIATSQFDETLVTLKVGSRGFLSLSGITKLKRDLLEFDQTLWKNFLIQMTGAVTSGSHKIWVTKNWVDLPQH